MNEQTTTNTAAHDEPLAVLPPVDDDAAGREAVREKMADAYAYTHWWVLVLGMIALLPATVLFRVERAARVAPVLEAELAQHEA